MDDSGPTCALTGSRPAVLEAESPVQFECELELRGSYAAVGLAGVGEQRLTAETLNRLAMLNMSAIRSMLTRSPSRCAWPRANRRKPSTAQSRRCGRGFRRGKAGSVEVPLRTRFLQGLGRRVFRAVEGNSGSHAGGIGYGIGRPVREDSWRLSPLPVMMLTAGPTRLRRPEAKRPVTKELARKAGPLSLPV